MNWGHANVADATLRAALVRDDDLENRGMHPDERETCHHCQAWATDEHCDSPEHDRMTSADMAFVDRGRQSARTATSPRPQSTRPWRT